MQSPIVQESCPGAPYHIRTQMTYAYARFLTSITPRSHDEDDADQSSLSSPMREFPVYNVVRREHGEGALSLEVTYFIESLSRLVSLFSSCWFLLIHVVEYT